MNTKTILTLAVIAALPFGAMAENISGDMYTAPATANNDHPAPTTQAWAPYGRIDIDTADQEHIATTAYVKGAYNSAIAAVNKVDENIRNETNEIQDNMSEMWGYIDNKQALLVNRGTDEAMSSDVIDADWMLGYVLLNVPQFDATDWEQLEQSTVSAAGVAAAVTSQRVTIYTTWDDDSSNATTQVALSTAL